jgi:hypothetical protein
VNIRFVSTLILFQKTLEYPDVTNLCDGKQEIQELQGRVLDAHTWAICKVVIEIMFPLVKQCIFNQTQGYRLLFDALNVTLSINVCM